MKELKTYLNEGFFTNVGIGIEQLLNDHIEKTFPESCRPILRYKYIMKSGKLYLRCCTLKDRHSAIIEYSIDLPVIHSEQLMNHIKDNTIYDYSFMVHSTHIDSCNKCIQIEYVKYNPKTRGRTEMDSFCIGEYILKCVPTNEHAPGSKIYYKWEWIIVKAE